jgi:hypothetical protein
MTFEEALKIARNNVEEALELVRGLPFETGPVTGLVWDYFGGIFKRVNEITG